METEFHSTNIAQTNDPRALQILKMTEETINLNEEVVNSVLDKVGNRRFVVWSMNGQTRTGKSFLLNYFIRYFEYHKNDETSQQNSSSESDWLNCKTYEFLSRSGKERTTVGIDLWSEPYFIRTSSGEEVAVLLMDTQGLFDDQTTLRQNAIIYSLSVLFSSVMIFNQMHNMNEDFLQKIQFFSQYAHAATVDSALSSASMNNAFQKLLFVIRDFQYPHYDYCCHDKSLKITGNNKNYFTDTFQPASRPSDYPEENVLVRKNILEVFESVAIYPLPDPGKQFKRQAQDPNKSKSAEPDEEFQNTAKQFIEWMVREENLEMKKVSNRMIRCEEFKERIRDWASLCMKAENVFPHVLTLAESAAITHYTIAKQLALTFYMDKMEECKEEATDFIQLDGFHQSALSKSIQIFHRAPKIRIENEKLKLNFVKQLESDINEHYEILKETVQFLLMEDDNFGKTQEIGEHDNGHEGDHPILSREEKYSTNLPRWWQKLLNGTKTRLGQDSVGNDDMEIGTTVHEAELCAAIAGNSNNLEFRHEKPASLNKDQYEEDIEYLGQKQKAINIALNENKQRIKSTETKLVAKRTDLRGLLDSYYNRRTMQSNVNNGHELFKTYIQSISVLDNELYEMEHELLGLKAVRDVLSKGHDEILAKIKKISKTSSRWFQ